jgi:hypothetical protein
MRYLVASSKNEDLGFPGFLIQKKAYDCITYQQQR